MSGFFAYLEICVYSMDLFFLVKLFFCDATSSWLLDWNFLIFWYHFFSNTLTHAHVLTIDNSYHSSYGNCEDDTQDSTERCTSNHHNEYEKRGEVECLAHHVWYKKVVLDTLDDEVENHDTKGYLPWYTKTNNRRWYECDKRSNIRDEFHNTTDKRESELLLYLEFFDTKVSPDESNIHDEFYEMESDICCDEDTHREDKCCLDPWGCDILDRLIMFCEIFLYSIRCNLHNESSYTSSLEYHKKCHDGYKSPVGNNSTNSSNYRYTTTREWWYLFCDNWLDIACILLDDIEYMLDIVLTEDKEDDLLDIWMKVKPLYSITQVYRLSSIDPIDNYCRSVCDILDNNWYERSYNDTTQKEYYYIHSYESQPWWYFIFLTNINKRIHYHSDESCYYENKKDSWYSP